MCFLIHDFFVCILLVSFLPDVCIGSEIWLFRVQSPTVKAQITVAQAKAGQCTIRQTYLLAMLRI